MNKNFREVVRDLATECGITDMDAAERFAVTLGQRWLGINTPFICGGSEEKDAMGLPKMITVCPSYGCDGFAIYERKGEYSAPGY
jgi:hypothetical protein